MASYVGRLGKVVLGTYTVADMTKWSVDGITTELIDDTSFTDTAKSFVLGITDYGTVSFDGHWDMSDTTGQILLDSANRNASKIGNIKFYINSVSYYTPNVTAVSDSGVLITSVKVDTDISGLAKISFQGKCTGPLLLV